jgi:hypothetical protein
MSQVKRLGYSRVYPVANPDLGQFTVKLIAKQRGITSYFSCDDDGMSTCMLFWDMSADIHLGKLLHGFSHIVDITANLSSISQLTPHTGPQGNRYWRAQFEVGVLFGGNELSAVLIWKDSYVSVLVTVFSSSPSSRIFNLQGNEQRSQSKIIPR